MMLRKWWVCAEQARLGITCASNQSHFFVKPEQSLNLYRHVLTQWFLTGQAAQAFAWAGVFIFET